MGLLRIQELGFFSRVSIAPGLMHNRRALEAWMRPCENLCFGCEECRKSLQTLQFILSQEETRVFLVFSDRDFAVGVIYFIGDSMHGGFFDGKILDKVPAFLEAMEIIKEQYGRVTTAIPEGSPMLKFATRKLGFKETGDLGPVWDNGPENLNVKMLEY